MSKLTAMRCEECGGHVATQAGATNPACLFCGALTLVERPPPPGIEPPSTWLPFRLEETQAQQSFATWAQGRFWAPASIRSATLELKALLLPAWVWSGVVESHWAAIVPGATRSGKRPRSGSSRLRINGHLVPASQTLRRAELNAIAPFTTGSERPLDADEQALPWEVGMLTRRAATQQAQAELASAHRQRISSEEGALELSSSCLFHDLEGRPLLLPVWIGAYRVGDRYYRVVLNGQDGKLVGDAPVSWWKVLGAVAAALVILGLGVLAFSPGGKG